MQRLFVQIRSHRKQIPSAVRQGDATAAFVLILADVAYAGRDYDRAESLSAAVLLRTKFSPTPMQRSYALYRRGRSRYAHPDRKLKHKARADYLASVKAASDAPWAAAALFLAANVSSNIDRNREAAIRGWRQVMRDYPESFEAERSGYYIGISYELSKRYKEAQTAYEEFERRYPDSTFRKLVKKHRLKVEAELRRTES